MTKSNIIDELAKRTGIKKKDAELAVDTVFDIIEESLASGEKVQISGFGTFELRERGSRRAQSFYGPADGHRSYPSCLV